MTAKELPPPPSIWRRWRRTSRARQEPVQPAHQRRPPGRNSAPRPPWINSVRTRVNKAQSRFSNGYPTIFRVPEAISRSHKAAYEPSVVCIGPLCPHSGYPTGCQRLEDCKWHILRCLLSRWCQNGKDASRVLDDCLTELTSRDADVRSCYSSKFPDMKPDDLATMMLLDGSFILIYLLLLGQEAGIPARSAPPPRAHRSETPAGSAEQASPNLTGQEEVSIVEKAADNAQESRSSKKEQGKGKGKVMGTVPESGSGSGLKPEPPPERKPQPWQQDCIQSRDVSESGSGSGSGSKTGSEWVDLEIGGGAENFDGFLLGSLWDWHLIVYDLLKLENQIPFFVVRLIYDKLFDMSSHSSGNVHLGVLALNLFSDIHPNKSRLFRIMPPNEIHHLLHLFHWSIVTARPTTQPEEQYEAGTTPERIPNATELAMAGVKFKPKKKSDCFLDISFENGVLEIPLLRIYDYTNSLFRNLIAFEQCFPDTDMDITIYANFMDCIVDTANDVRLLNTKGILVHRLSTDEEVASLFNQLCYQVHYYPKKNYLKKLFAQVTSYHESKWHQYRAGLARDYFSNPWVIISVLAATLLLLLTIEQSFFTAFSYFRPPTSS